MNKVYKVIFNHTLQVYQVVSELAKGHSKSKTPDIVRERHAGRGTSYILPAALLAAMALLSPSYSFAADEITSVNAGTNIVVSDKTEEGAVTVSTKDNPTFTSVTAGAGTKQVVLGDTGVAVGGKTYITDSGLNANSQKITGVTAGNIASDSTEAVNGGQLYTTNQTVNMGWDAQANGTTVKTVTPSSNTLNFKNGDNISIFNDTGAIKISTVPNPNFTSVKVNDKTYISSTGLNANDQKITNVADGVDETDAVNKKQLDDSMKYFKANDADPLGEDAKATGAGAIAIGSDAVSKSENAVAMGLKSKAEGVSSIAIGDKAQSTDANGTAVGTNAVAGGNASAFGTGAIANGGSSVALGGSAVSSGGSSVALGNAAKANGASSLALGNLAVANSLNDISLGNSAGAVSSGQGSGLDQQNRIAIGTQAGQNVTGNEIISIGLNAGQGIKGNYNIAIGSSAGTGSSGEKNTSIGYNAKGSGSHSTAIGAETQAAQAATALGYKANAAKDNSVAIGYGAEATDSSGVAIGSTAVAKDTSIALGNASHASQADSAGLSYLTGQAAGLHGVVSVGSSDGDPSKSFQRRIVNVADGFNGKDAVNVDQLKAAQTSVGKLIGGGVTLNADGTYTKFTVKGTDGELHSFNTLAEALAKVNADEIQVASADAVTYSDSTHTNINADATISKVANAKSLDQAVNLGQMNASIEASKVKYYSVNSTESGNRDNTGATGADAIAAGPAAIAKGNRSISVGYNTKSEGEYSIVIGNAGTASSERQVVAYDTSGIAIGTSASSTGTNSIALGTYAETNEKESASATSNSAIAIGDHAHATDNQAVALGYYATASGLNSFAQGNTSTAMATDSIAIGTSSKTSKEAEASLAIGKNATTGAKASMAVGLNAATSGEASLALGMNATTNGTHSGLIGTAMSTDKDQKGTTLNGSDTYVVGNGNGTVGGTNSSIMGNSNTVGTTTKDAEGKIYTHNTINTGILGNSNTVVATGSAIIGYDNESGKKGSAADAYDYAKDSGIFGNKNKTTGEGNRLIGNSNNDSDKDDVFILGNGVTAGLGNSVYLGANSAYVASDDTSKTTAGADKYDKVTVGNGTYTFAGSEAKGVVTVGSVDATRRLQNVSAGLVSATSTDAVNGSQLHALTQPLRFAGDNSTVGNYNNATTGDNNVIKRSSDQAIKVTGGAALNNLSENNIGVVAAPGTNTLTVQLSKDLTGLNSVTTGNTVMNNDGVTITGGSKGTVSLTNTGLNNGNNTIINVASGVNGTDAVNVNQLEGAKTDLTNKGLKFGANSGTAVTNKLGSTVNVKGAGTKDDTEYSGSNIKTKVSQTDGGDTTIDVMLANDINLGPNGSVTIGGKTYLSNAGLNAGGNKITNVADGGALTDAVNVGQLNKAAAGSKTTVSDGVNTTVTSTTAADGHMDYKVNLNDKITLGEGANAVTLDGTTGRGSIGNVTINGSGSNGTVNGLTNKTWNPDTYVTGQAATEDQLRQASSQLKTAGLDFVDNDGKMIHKNLGDQLNIVGGYTKTDTSSKNIKTVVNGSHFEIHMTENPEFTSVTTGSTVMNSSGITIGTGDHAVSLTHNGLNNGGNKITNVAEGVAGTDAVNVDQLHNTVNEAAAAAKTTVSAGSNITVTPDNTAADGHTNYKVALNDTVTLGTGDNAVTMDGTKGTISAGTKVSFDGTQGTGTIGNVTINGSGSTGTVNGLTNKTWEPDKFVTGQAASEDQLKALDDRSVQYDRNEDGSVNKGKMTLGGDGGTTITNVKDGDVSASSTDAVNGSQLHALTQPLRFAGDNSTVGNYNNATTGDNNVIKRSSDQAIKVTGGAALNNLSENNIGVVAAPGTNTLTVQLSKDLTGLNSVTTGNTVMNNDGVTITGGSKGTVSLTNTGLNNGNNTIINVASGVNGTDAVNVNQLEGAKTDLTNKGLKFGANSGTAVTNKLGSTVNVKGAGTKDDTEYSGSNIKTKVSQTDGGDTTIDVMLANDINLGPNGSVTIGGKTYLSNAGLNAGGNKITNVADGGALTDAVNVGQLNKAAAGSKTTVSDGVNTTVTSTTAADGHMDYKVNLNDKITLGEGANAVTLDGTTGRGSIGNVTINGSGSNGTVNGLTNKTWNPDTYVTGQAATEDQLRQASSQLKTAGLDFVDNDGKMIHKNLGDQLNIVGGYTKTDTSSKNIKTVVNGSHFEIHMTENPEFTSVTTGSTVMNSSGITIGTGDHAVSLTHNGLNNGGNKITNVAEGVAGTDAVNVDQLHNTVNEAAAAAKTTVSAGSNITVTPDNTAADGHTNYKVALNDTVTLGTGDNAVTMDGTKGTISAGTKVSFDGTQGTGTIGNVTINGSGSTGTVNGLTNKTWEPDKFVTGQAASEDQLKALDDRSVQYDRNEDGSVNKGKMTLGGDGGTTITNVKDGDVSASSTDAVNGSQLYATNQAIVDNSKGINILGGAVNKLGKRINRVGAGAAALAGLHPLDFDPDAKWDFAAGYGNYRGANAVAIGTYYRPNEDTMFSVGGSFGGGENMVNAGVTLKLGSGSNHVSTSRVAMAKELKDVRAVVAQQAEQIQQLAAMINSLTGVQAIAPDTTTMFPDVPQNHWAYEAVKEMADRGLIEGYPNGTFGGDRAMTRYEFAQIVYRALQTGAAVDGKLVSEFKPELERIRVDTVSQDKKGNPTIERVRVNK